MGDRVVGGRSHPKGRVNAVYWYPRPAVPVERPDPVPTVGLVTALPEEFTAMRVLIDGGVRLSVHGDRAAYLLGSVPSTYPAAPHRTALTLLGHTGAGAAAASCANLIRSFPSVTCVVMVGIAAGVPRPRQPERHVRLGDVVVSTWGVVDDNHLVETPEGRRLKETVPRPSPLLVRAAGQLRADEELGTRPWEQWLDPARTGLRGYDRPPATTDVLYAGEPGGRPVPHPPLELSGHRPGWPKVHHGLIGSAGRTLRSTAVRDELAADHELFAVEMEGPGIGTAGFAGGLDWLVVRGISDYGDHRTSPIWRSYAALAAAVYTRALLAVCAPLRPRPGRTAAT